MGKKKIKDKIFKLFGVAKDHKLSDIVDEVGPSTGNNGQLHRYQPSSSQQQYLPAGQGIQNPGKPSFSKSNSSRNNSNNNGSGQSSFQIRAEYSPTTGRVRQSGSGSSVNRRSGCVSAHMTTSSQGPRSTTSGLSSTNIKLSDTTSITEHRDEKLKRLVEDLNSTDPGVQGKAAEKLFNMTHKDYLDRHKIYELGAIQSLVNILESKNQQAVVYAAFIISALSSIESAKQELLDYNAIHGLLAVMSDSSTMVACKRGAIRAIARLSRSEFFVSEIIDQGGLVILQSILQASVSGSVDDNSSDVDDYITRRALLSVYFIAADRVDLSRMIAQQGLVGDILALVASGSEEVQIEAMDVIKVLSRDPVCGNVIVYQTTGLAKLQSIATSSPNPDLRRIAKKCIQRLAELDSVGQHVLKTVGNGVIQEDPENEEINQFIEYLQSSSVQLRGQAAHELARAADGDAPVQQSLLHTGAITHLVDVLNGVDVSHEAREGIVGAIHQMSQNTDTAAKLAGYDVIPALISVTPLLNDNALYNIGSTFAVLVAHQKCCVAMAGEHGVAALLDILERGSMAAQESAIAALCCVRDKVKTAEDALVKLQGVPLLIGLIWACSSSSVKLRSVALLQQLLPHSDVTQQVVLGGGFQALMSQLERHYSAEQDKAYTDCINAILGRSKEYTQLNVEGTIQEHVSTQVRVVEHSLGHMLPAWVEECLRIIPREVFVGKTNRHVAYENRPLFNTSAGVMLPPPELDVRTLMALDVKPGMSVLDVGFGTGYMSALFSYLVQETGELQAIECNPEVCAYGQTRYWSVITARRLLNVPKPTFLLANLFSVHQQLGRFDRVYVGAQVPRSVIPLLQRLCNRSAGRLVVGVEDKVLLYRFDDGREHMSVVSQMTLPPVIMDGPGVGGGGQDESGVDDTARPFAGGMKPRGAAGAGGEPVLKRYGSEKGVDVAVVQQQQQQQQQLQRRQQSHHIRQMFHGVSQQGQHQYMQQVAQYGRGISPSPSAHHGLPPNRPVMPDTPHRSPTMHPRGAMHGHQSPQLLRSKSAHALQRAGSSGAPLPYDPHSASPAAYSRASTPSRAGDPSPGGYAASSRHPRADASPAHHAQIPRSPPPPHVYERGSDSGKRNAQPGYASSSGSAHSKHSAMPQSSHGRSQNLGFSIHPSSTSPYVLTMEDIKFCRTQDGKKCRLGEGGFGVVYKALMNGVDEVAVKVVKTSDKPTEKEFKQFDAEVRVLASLHHRNIVQFYGASIDTAHMFFVTELMKGGDLYSALRYHKETMQWDVLGRKVAQDVALGLNYLHTRRPPMMHRDLKSPNVLLSEEGVAKIADVGMVRSANKELVTAQPVMTPLWAAPEVTRHERASVKADIWSFGILVWEVMTGNDITEYAPLALTRQAEQNKNLARPKGKLMELPAKCPPLARKVFNMCTEMDPDRRPTAAQIADLLRQNDKNMF